MIHVREVLLSTQVTSVEIKENVVFIGEGQYLHIHSLVTGENLTSIRVFRAAVVHGIQIEPSPDRFVKLLLWGQKSLAIAYFDPRESICWLHLQEIHFEDWIVDAKWKSTACILVATAHNALLQVSLKKEGLARCDTQVEKSAPANRRQDSDYEIVAKEQCSENCILYCGFIVLDSNSWGDVALLAGTVFSQILIWGPWGERNHLGRIIPSHRLTGHQGVLFSVNFCWEKRVITSTSDDRSLRVWRVCQDEVILNSTKPKCLWQNCRIAEELKCFGHGSRVWKSLILPACYLSVGEDSKVCVWGLDGSLLSSWKAHDGSCIWSVGVSEDAKIVVTGGGDGSVKSWCLKLDGPKHPEVMPKLPWILCDGQNDAHNLEGVNSLQDDKAMIVKDEFDNDPVINDCDETPNFDGELFSTSISNAQVKNSKRATRPKDDFPRCVALLGSDVYLVMMDSGKLYSWVTYLCEWFLVYEDARFKNYSLLESSPDGKFVALGTLSGDVVVLGLADTRQCMKVICNESILDSKVFSLLWLNSQGLLACGSEGRMMNFCLSEGKLHKRQTYILPVCKQRWVSAACLFAVADKSHLVCGDRAGSIHLFANDAQSATHSLRSLHGKNGVTSLSNFRGLLYSTGRDGCVRSLTVQNDRLLVLTVTRVGNISWVASLVNVFGRPLTVCFHDIKLKLWSLEEDRAIVDLECGGGHRSWALQASEGDDKLSFMYIKDTMPYAYSTTLRDKLMPLIKTPVNTRETTCLERLFQEEDLTIFATGGEDTTFRLHAILAGKLSTMSVIRSHISNIRAICSIEDVTKETTTSAEKSVWVITAGGRAQLKVWKVTRDLGTDDRVDLIDPLAVGCREVASHMLRTGSGKTWKSQEMTLDPETRYMDATAFWVSDTMALIAMASSDGVLRFFVFDSDQERLQLLIAETWDHCLLRVERIHIGDLCILTSTATDGFIVFWDIQSLIKTIQDSGEVDDDCPPKPNIREISRIKAHQSGINSIAINVKPELGLNSGSFKVASGGDDNKVAVWEIIASIKGTEVSLATAHVCDVFGHASQITGLSWLTETYLMSASIDQRIVVWKMTPCKDNRSDTDQRTDTVPVQDNVPSVSDNHLKLEAVSSHFSGVPDIKGASVCTLKEMASTAESNKNEIHSKRILVYGVGLQVYDVSIEKS